LAASRRAGEEVTHECRKGIGSITG
jgi:hypothetical protein